MRSSSWDQSSHFLLREHQTGVEHWRDYTHHAATAHGASHDLLARAIARRRGSGSPLAVTVGGALAGERPAFFADLQGLASLICVVLPELIPRRIHAQSIKLWLAGCDTGQDAYSLAMALVELCPHLANWDVAIVGTDPDRGAIARAERGIYTRSEVERGLPTEWLVRHFEQLSGGRGWRFCSPLTKRMIWLQLEPTESCAAVGVADVIICRQSLEPGEGDRDRRRQLFRRLTAQLASDGFLILPGRMSDLEREPGFECPCAGGSRVYRRSLRQTSLLSA